MAYKEGVISDFFDPLPFLKTSTGNRRAKESPPRRAKYYHVGIA